MIYADYAATTPVDPRVAERMLSCLREDFYNPSSVYPAARKVRSAVEAARDNVRALIGAEDGRVIFTSGGTEADNLAVLGTALHPENHKRHIITTAIEHHAILESCEWLETQGFRVTYLPVDRRGRISLEDLRNAIDDDTFLVSVMWVNNEIGTVQDIDAISEIVHSRGVLFHSDAVQAMTSQHVSTEKVDLLTLSSHKIYGPKGAGALYVRDNVPLSPVMHGGQQEMHLRGGTENVPSIVGFGEAARLLKAEREELIENMHSWKKYLTERLSGTEGLIINSPMDVTADTVFHFSVKDAEAEGLLLKLAMSGVMASMGSACNTESVEPSHVVKAIGLGQEYIRGSIRISMGRGLSMKDIEELAEKIAKLCS